MLYELEIKQKVCKVIEQQLGKPTGSISMSSTVQELGIDSLDTIEIIMGLEEEFDVEIDELDLVPMKNIGELRDYICNKVFLYKPTDSGDVVSKIQQVTSDLSEEEDIYTIKLDADSMSEAVVKFLTQCHKDTQKFPEDDGIQDSILDVIRFCTTASEYDSILVELGIE